MLVLEQKEQKINKSVLRKRALEKRAAFNKLGIIEKSSKIIVSKILNSDIYKNAKNIALYFPIKNEIDLTSLLCDKDKKFYFPCCHDSELEFREFLGCDKLKEGKFGILEPLGEVVEPKKLNIVFTPALLVNRHGFRLGYGKGFYDRFFNKYKEDFIKVAVVQSQFVSDEFVQDDFDIKCDYILSD